jgi:hypothetical protein
MKKTLLPFLLVLCLVMNLNAADKPSDKDNKEQTGIGLVNTFVSHGQTVFRFMPDDKELRMIKFVPGQLGYGKALPKEMNDLLDKALKEKLKINLSCQYFDHGPGKPAIGKKVFSLTLVDAPDKDVATHKKTSKEETKEVE